MIKVKHLMDAAEVDDGARLWVEPIPLTHDLRAMCLVHHVLCELGPPRELWDWFERHPAGYEYFRGRYHLHLERQGLKPILQQLVSGLRRQNITLLHQGADPSQNTATALYEFLNELRAYCEPEAE
jgi:uncharacterized protein YeaO (DUF488 family)